jgi:hypothetical protein
MNAKSILKLVFAPLLLLSSVTFIVIGCASSSSSSSSSSSGAAREQFASPDVAMQALVKALRNNDEAQLKKILAPAGDEILSSGDPVADRADVERFLMLYAEGHRFETDSAAGVSTLLIGREDWPFPVPIVKAGKKYEFDVETGEDEILNRRIGRNELSTQQACLAIVDAQRDYVAINPTNSDLPLYARKLVSDPGQKNGLYWPTAEGEPESPMGPLVATAADEGYGKPAQSDSPETRPPYHGYRYRLLTAQGPHAAGGAADYVVDGKLIGGFGVIAYPAQYGNSGIVTFITNHDGVVYQRDLGPDSQKIAEGITAFDPGPEWTKCAETSDPGSGT